MVTGAPSTHVGVRVIMFYRFPKSSAPYFQTVMHIKARTWSGGVIYWKSHRHCAHVPDPHTGCSSNAHVTDPHTGCFSSAYVTVPHTGRSSSAHTTDPNTGCFSFRRVEHGLRPPRRPVTPVVPMTALKET